MSNDGLQVQTPAAPKRQIVVSAVGDIDMVGGKQLLRDFNAALRGAEQADSAIDMAEVTFIDSSGISALLLCRRTATATGGSFRVLHVPPPVLRTLQLAGVSTALGVNGEHPFNSAMVPERDQDDITPPVAADHSVPALLAALSHHFVADATMDETLKRIAEVTRRAIPRADYASTSMTVDGRFAAHRYADSQVTIADRLQYENGDGPCIDTLMRGAVTVLPSTRSDGPYPAFRKATRGLGIFSALCVPISAGTEVIGAITLYSETDNAFSPHDVEVALRFATQAAFLLLNAQAYWNARTLSENLAQAMQSRAQIEQAKGIIMANSGLSADDAFAQLVKQSQHQNVKVRELAMEIVRHSQRGRSQ